MASDLGLAPFNPSNLPWLGKPLDMMGMVERSAKFSEDREEHQTNLVERKQRMKEGDQRMVESVQRQSHYKQQMEQEAILMPLRVKAAELKNTHDVGVIASSAHKLTEDQRTAQNAIEGEAEFYKWKYDNDGNLMDATLPRSLFAQKLAIEARSFEGNSRMEQANQQNLTAFNNRASKLQGADFSGIQSKLLANKNRLDPEIWGMLGRAEIKMQEDADNRAFSKARDLAIAANQFDDASKLERETGVSIINPVTKAIDPEAMNKAVAIKNKVTSSKQRQDLIVDLMKANKELTPEDATRQADSIISGKPSGDRLSYTVDEEANLRKNLTELKAAKAAGHTIVDRNQLLKNAKNASGAIDTNPLFGWGGTSIDNAIKAIEAMLNAGSGGGTAKRFTIEKVK